MSDPTSQVVQSADISVVDPGEYVEEEVEVTDEEEVVEEETPVVTPMSTKEAKRGKASTTPSKSPAGKVTVSEEVKKAPMESPQSLAAKAAGGLTSGKSPFNSNGVWNEKTLSQIRIRFPVLTSKDETTNELTRNTRPEARYWRSPVSFEFEMFTSTTLRFDNVHIPYHSARGYGENYIYVTLPHAASVAFSQAGKEIAPTRVTEKSLLEDPERWWKIANNFEGNIGIVNTANNKFQPKSLATIFQSTEAGVTCNLTLKFNCKASTEDKEPLRATVVRTLSIEIVRGYIVKTDVNVQLPARVSKEKAKVDHVATKRDVADDGLMHRLRDLGL